MKLKSSKNKLHVVNVYLSKGASMGAKDQIGLEQIYNKTLLLKSIILRQVG